MAGSKKIELLTRVRRIVASLYRCSVRTGGNKAEDATGLKLWRSNKPLRFFFVTQALQRDQQPI